MAFRILLLGLWVILCAYTGLVIARFGFGLFPIFFGAIADPGWPGQFNLDFTCLLILSANWTAWRHRFDGVGLMLAPVALFGGAGFLLPYLLILSIRAKGDMRAVLLGRQA